MLKIAGFTIEELFICAMIVGMVDVFEELVIEPIEKYNLNNPNKEKNENTHITLFTAYKTHFNKLFDTVKTHHSIDKISDQILSIDKNTLTRMCLAVSAANVKGARIIQGKLDNLPEPTTVYPVNDTQLSSSNLKLFLNNIEERFSKYEDYYEYVDKIISQTTSKNEETEKETDTKNKSPKKSKVEKNSFCSIQ